MRTASLLLSHPKVTRVVDVGAGKVWHFPDYYKKWYGIHLIGIDIDAAEMTDNTMLDEKIVADVVQSIPVEPGSTDLIMIRSGLEHFSDNERFLRNAFTSLRPGGFMVAFFPNRYAPFAILNRLLPQRVAKRVLRTTTLEDSHELGFRAYYDRTDYDSFRKMSTDVGFDVVHHLPSFYSSYYFQFFVPLFLLSHLYDSMRLLTGNPRLASYHIWVLQKPGQPAHEGAPRFSNWRINQLAPARGDSWA
jgi:SAM-dependent methyltransferase